MEPIDKPFRFTWDFCVVWGLLVSPIYLMTRQIRGDTPWYSFGVFIIMLSLIVTFLIYGPVLLARQIIHSGAHGRLVLRILISIVLTAILLFLGLIVSGLYSSGAARTFAFFFIVVAIVYLHWRTDEKNQ